MRPSTDRDKLQAADKPTLYKQIRVCAENLIRVDDVTESPKSLFGKSGMSVSADEDTGHGDMDHGG